MLEQKLIENLSIFSAFVRRRVSDPELADDVLQESLLKALRSAETIEDEERVQAWFYRILRRSIIDLHRRKGIEERALKTLGHELDEPAQRAVFEQTACECFKSLLPTLKPEYAEVLKAVDLDERTSISVARALGITPNNLKVRRHRARAQLRERLEETCRLCAAHGCLDCTCRERPSARKHKERDES